MVVDTSALVAIVLLEEDAEQFARAMEAAQVLRMTAVNWMEAGVVLDRLHGGATGLALDELVARAGIRIEPVTMELAAAARTAYAKYGKGIHPAGLNFADCYSYALAIQHAEPLLFKGDDFVATDVRRWR